MDRSAVDTQGENIMPRNEAEKNINSMPMEHMIEAPIIAAAKAQREISGMLADYLDKPALVLRAMPECNLFMSLYRKCLVYQ